MIALSLHSLFEGMAVGLEESSGGVWQLFMAIAIHSTAIVFCIGTGIASIVGCMIITAILQRWLVMVLRRVR